jgi:hypothetical protein
MILCRQRERACNVASWTTRSGEDPYRWLLTLLNPDSVLDTDNLIESVAETSHKPLYLIGTGELGTDVEYTELTLFEFSIRLRIATQYYS